MWDVQWGSDWLAWGAAEVIQRASPMGGEDREMGIRCDELWVSHVSHRADKNRAHNVLMTAFKTQWLLLLWEPEKENQVSSFGPGLVHPNYVSLLLVNWKDFRTRVRVKRNSFTFVEWGAICLWCAQRIGACSSVGFQRCPGEPASLLTSSGLLWMFIPFRHGWGKWYAPSQNGGYGWGISLPVTTGSVLSSPNTAWDQMGSLTFVDVMSCLSPRSWQCLSARCDQIHFTKKPIGGRVICSRLQSKTPAGKSQQGSTAESFDL